VTTDLNTLLTALYVRIDDYLAPRRRVGRRPRLTDAELLTLAVAQVLWGFAPRPAGCGWYRGRCPGRSPICLASPGYNKRLRGALPRGRAHRLRGAFVARPRAGETPEPVHPPEVLTRSS
jgi:hypothetical protein